MRYSVLPLLILLAACSGEDKSAGGVTANEARALDDAAEMLEEQRLPAGAVPSGPAAQPAPAPAQTTPAKPPAKPAG